MIVNSRKYDDVSVATTDYLEKLKVAFMEFFKDEDVKVVLFGSRARGDSISASDVDVGIIFGEDSARGKLILLREYIEDLNIPYKVEIVDFSTVSEVFKEMALKEAVVWKG